MSASSIGALNTVFMRLTMVSQYGRAALGGWYSMYSAEWQATQVRCAALKPGSELDLSCTPSGGNWMLLAATVAAPMDRIVVIVMAEMMEVRRMLMLLRWPQL